MNDFRKFIQYILWLIFPKGYRWKLPKYQETKLKIRSDDYLDDGKPVRMSGFERRKR